MCLYSTSLLQQKQVISAAGGGSAGGGGGGGGGGGEKGKGTAEGEQLVKRSLSRQHAKDISDYTKQLLAKDKELDNLRKRLGKVRSGNTHLCVCVCECVCVCVCVCVLWSVC